MQKFIVGRVLSERHFANMQREILLLADHDSDVAPEGSSSSTSGAGSGNKEYRIRLNAEEYDGVAMWMTIKKARQLICEGVRIEVRGQLQQETAGNDEKTSALTENENDTPTDLPQIMHATSIQLIAALPTKTYLATLLSFSLEDLHKLFPNDAITVSAATLPTNDTQTSSKSKSLPTGVSVACCTTTIPPSRLEKAASFCRAEKQAGRADKLWNASLVKDLVQALQDHHEAHGTLTIFCDESRKHGQLPRVSKRVWKALQRVENRWLSSERDGEIGEYDYDMPTHSYRTKRKYCDDADDSESKSLPQPTMNTPISKTMVEHAQNLPDQQDARRLKYIDQRKRPQVHSMLQFIHQLLSKRVAPTKSKTKDDSSTRQQLRLVEIGGGRGYLAHEVAAFYNSQQSNKNDDDYASWDVHVTVVDNNDTSLQAGRKQAEQAGLMNRMTFVLCDLSDEQQVEDVLLTSTTTKITLDLVFGLHCCGGLAEAAVEVAIKTKASFCISTCCFRSIPQLASLTRLAVEVWAREEAAKEVSSGDNKTENENPLQCQVIQQQQQGIQEDMNRVASLAVNVGAAGQHRAIRACNAVRLFATRKRFDDDATPAEDSLGDFPLQVWQESFPVEYSVQNRILMGSIKIKK